MSAGVGLMSGSNSTVGVSGQLLNGSMLDYAREIFTKGSIETAGGIVGGNFLWQEAESALNGGIEKGFEGIKTNSLDTVEKFFKPDNLISTICGSLIMSPGIRNIAAYLNRTKVPEGLEKQEALDISILNKPKKLMNEDDFKKLRQIAGKLERTPENAIKIGSEKTWAEYLKAYPSKDLNKAADDYIELIINTNPWAKGKSGIKNVLHKKTIIRMAMSPDQRDDQLGGWARKF